MRKGFTLLELIIVIIIVGILATLGFTQYSAMIEKSRGAEAKAILGNIRTMAAAFYLEHGNSLTPGGAVPNFNNAAANIGAGLDQIPSACRNTHYFNYVVGAPTGPAAVTVTATRCNAGGKAPDSLVAGKTLTLAVNLAGNDIYGGNGGF